jgi:hypothetical protein
MPEIVRSSLLCWSARDLLTGIENNQFSIQITKNANTPSINAKVTVLMNTTGLEKVPFIVLPETDMVEKVAYGMGKSKREGISYNPWITEDGQYWKDMLQLIAERAMEVLDLPENTVSLVVPINDYPIFLQEPWKDAKQPFSFDEYLQSEGRILLKFNLYVKTVEQTGASTLYIGYQLARTKYNALEQVAVPRSRTNKRKAEPPKISNESKEPEEPST